MTVPSIGVIRDGRVQLASVQIRKDYGATVEIISGPPAVLDTVRDMSHAEVHSRNSACATMPIGPFQSSSDFVGFKHQRANGNRERTANS